MDRLPARWGAHRPHPPYRRCLSYGSVRRAMEVLRERGLIVTRHGRGLSSTRNRELRVRRLALHWCQRGVQSGSAAQHDDAADHVGDGLWYWLAGEDIEDIVGELGAQPAQDVPEVGFTEVSLVRR